MLGFSLGWGLFIPSPLQNSPPIRAACHHQGAGGGPGAHGGPRMLVALILVTLMLAVAGHCASAIPCPQPRLGVNGAHVYM